MNQGYTFELARGGKRGEKEGMENGFSCPNLTLLCQVIVSFCLDVPKTCRKSRCALHKEKELILYCRLVIFNHAWTYMFVIFTQCIQAWCCFILSQIHESTPSPICSTAPLTFWVPSATLIAPMVDHLQPSLGIVFIALDPILSCL